MSHLHPDHTNGIRAADGSMAFPNAEIMVPAEDWKFWMSEDNAAKAQSNEMMKNYFANVRKIYNGIESKVTKYEWGKEVAPGITSISTPGHTPGHTSFAVQSGTSKILIQSDVTNIPELFLRNPDWHVAFDVDGDLAQQTRHKFYDMAAAEKMTVVGFHFTFPSIGHVEKDGKGYRLIPSALESDDLIAVSHMKARRAVPIGIARFFVCERCVSGIMWSMHLHGSRDAA